MYALSGTKGYFWLEASMAQGAKVGEDYDIDKTYFDKLIDEAINTINKYTDARQFILEE